MISAVRAPLRSVIALMTTVQPWTKNDASAKSIAPACTESRTPREKAAGVVGTFAAVSSPVRSS